MPMFILRIEVQGTIIERGLESERRSLDIGHAVPKSIHARLIILIRLHGQRIAPRDAYCGLLAVKTGISSKSVGFHIPFAVQVLGIKIFFRVHPGIEGVKMHFD